MAKQTLTALYDSRDDAETALSKLKQAGVPASDVTLSPATVAAGDVNPEAKGFWASLEAMFGGYDEHDTYAEGVRRGGTLLTAHVDDAQADDVIAILDQHGSVDLDERETAWRNEGWAGQSVSTAGATLLGAGSAGVASTGMTSTADFATRGDASTLSARTDTTAASTSARAGGDDVIQVLEEQLKVGKRSVSRGKVRLHAYVVETPVSDQVSLREETVTIDRRPVDRVLAAGETVDLFQERVVEMEEVNEEAVVGKTTRVVEEIGIRKDATDQVKTISDTVRSTKVDIEDGRHAGVGVGVASGPSEQVSKDTEVVGSDGQHVGVIDHVQGDTIKLKKLDPSAGGEHHTIPTSWVASTDGVVRLKTSAAEAKRGWTAAG